jgi:son of sevenless
LTDFGLSKLLEEVSPSYFHTKLAAVFKRSGKVGRGNSTVAETNPRWFAPELITQHEARSTHSDTWSFGMVCLEVMTGEQPFSDMPRDVTVAFYVSQGKTPARPGPNSPATSHGLDDNLWSLIRQCWNKKSKSRPSMTNVKEKLQQLQAPTTDQGTYILIMCISSYNFRWL